jgi:hypothetical protein
VALARKPNKTAKIQGNPTKFPGEIPGAVHRVLEVFRKHFPTIPKEKPARRSATARGQLLCIRQPSMEI